MLELSDDEAWEANDALGEVINRMLLVGQTTTEIKYRSLQTAWAVQKRIVAARLKPLPDWVAHREAEVAAAVDSPKVLGDIHWPQAFAKLVTAGRLQISES
jgi:hypothetical protein